MRAGNRRGNNGLSRMWAKDQVKVAEMTKKCPKCGKFMKGADRFCRSCREAQILDWGIIEALLQEGVLKKIPEKGLSRRELQILYSEQVTDLGLDILGKIEEFYENSYIPYRITERERVWNG